METLRLSWDVGRGAIVRQPEGTKKMTCAQCGLPLPPDVGFCRACGAFVRPRSMTAPPVSTPAVIQPHDLSSSPPTAAPTPPPWAAVPGAASAAASARGAAPLPGTRTPPSLLGDVLAAAGAGLVLILMFLSWYSVTLTALGVQLPNRSNGRSCRGCSPRLPAASPDSPDPSPSPYRRWARALEDGDGRSSWYR